jgi:beta-glucosidase
MINVGIFNKLLKKPGLKPGMYPFQNADLPFEDRALDLIKRMTLKEKVSQMWYKSAGIPHLGILPYDWWNECLHGVGRAGIATVFPQAIGLAATFNPDLIFKMATVISDEARAKHHEFQRQRDYGRYKGLTFWSPNINIFRDPRWGRGQETYGEDPYLTGRIGVAFIKGLQGDHPKYLKLVATAKHYAVHSGLEKERHHFNAVVGQKDLYETYLPHFKEAVQEARVESIMCAYNRTNNEVCCASPTLLQRILRDAWDFQGYVVSDCGAIGNIHRTHKVTKSAVESAALAVLNGCDLDCGWTFRNLVKAVKRKLLTEADIDRALHRLMVARFKLGMFDPPELVPYQNIPYSKNDCAEHRALALKVAQQTLVLLKNAENFLPVIDLAKFNHIAVIGPNADDEIVLRGNYEGVPSKAVSIFAGIKARVENRCRLSYAKGCSIKGTDDAGVAEAVKIGQSADLIIACLGLSQALEGEEKFGGSDDRKDLALPPGQDQLLHALATCGKPMVVVLLNGSPVSIPWAHDCPASQIPAILEAWYPGEEGGTAVASVLFGDYSPAGRLPITIAYDNNDLPDVRDYRMTGRTYRYLQKEPLYPFGYGLSFTKFAYSNLQLSKSTIPVGETVNLKVTVKNVGKYAGDEVVQLYIRDLVASVAVPHHSLRGIQRITLEPGQSMDVQFAITPQCLSLITEEGKRVLEPGDFEIFIGGSQPDVRSVLLTGSEPLKVALKVIGEKKALPY